MRKFVITLFLLLMIIAISRLLWTVNQEKNLVADICGLSLPIDAQLDKNYTKTVFTCKIANFSKLAFWQFKCSDIKLPICAVDENSASLCQIQIDKGLYKGNSEECELSYVCPNDLSLYQTLQDNCLNKFKK